MCANYLGMGHQMDISSLPPLTVGTTKHGSASAATLSGTRFRPNLILSIFVFPFLVSLPAVAEDIIYPGYNDVRFDGENLYPQDSTSDNTVTVNDTPGNPLATVQGGAANTGQLFNNTVTVNGGTVSLGIYGARLSLVSENNVANNNTVNVTKDFRDPNYTIDPTVIGGMAFGGEANGNTVIMSGDSVGGQIQGGRGEYADNNTVILGENAISSGTLAGGDGDSGASNNTVYLRDNAESHGYSLYGGHGDRVTNNKVFIQDNATVSSGTTLAGGYTYRDGAYSNSVSISGGTVSGNVYGGRGIVAHDNHVVIEGGNLDNSAGMVAGGASSEANGSPSDNSVTVIAGNVAQTIYGGYDRFASGGVLANNKVNLEGGVVTGAVYGGYGNGSVTGNEVTIGDGATVGGTDVAGGMTETGVLGNNKVTVTGGTVTAILYGALARNGDGTAVVNNNHVILRNGTVADVYGAYGESGETVNANDVTIDNAGGNPVANAVTGGAGTGNVSDNKVFLRSGKVDILTGGEGKGNGTVSGNTVQIIGGTVTNTAGGRTATGTASGNIVSVKGGTLNGGTYGGYSDSTGSVSGNLVVLENGQVGDVYAGYSNSGTVNDNTIVIAPVNGNLAIGGSLYGSNNGGSRNTLDIRRTGLTAKNVSRFENYRFVLPSGIQAGETVLTLTASENTDLEGSTVGVGVAAGGSPVLQAGDRVTLIHKNAGQLTGSYSQNSLRGQQGVSLKYDFDLSNTDTDLVATVKSVSVNPEVSVFNSGRLATLGFLNEGTDFALTEGVKRIMDTSSARGTRLYGAISGSDLRYDTGKKSHADASGTYWLIGATGKLDNAPNRDLTASVYIEAGWGDITGNNPSTSGSGDTRYYGLGAIGRYQQKEGPLKGAYAQLNAKAGRTTTDFDSHILDGKGQKTGYDKEATYYGAGLGIGYQWNLTNASQLDLFADYQWTRLEGFDADIGGDLFQFDDIDSHRTKVGAKLSFTENRQYTPYIGLAWEHEYSGTARGSVYEYRLEENSLKGDSGIGEIGIRFSPEADSAWRIDAAVRGYVGQREGVAGNLVFNYLF
ncbi:hypothetical protein OFAG_00598 [Oxalobacter formigenes HOxBLS]|uniref:Autotransporter domain-containing protein n=3 Tax=Oxalobacter paraformigenes TaxID=556268 RepID=C3X2K9_9BURK|nr:hypothetical protein OFAG_00598 [Oxalobacter paraformigenes]